jgi:predicted phage baseplate assembly protein
VFDADSRRVRFGNGLNGQVPTPGQDIVARKYHVSAGRSGNVAKDLLWKFKNRVVPGITLKNPQPAIGGADPESLKDLELRARALLNRPQRAVTLDDIERLALDTPGIYVARATAIPNSPTPGQISIVVVQKVRPGRKGPPTLPSDAFLSAVGRHLQQRRLLCDNLRVVRPIYLEVSVSARLRLAKGAGPAAVIERARQALAGFLAGEDQDSASEPSQGAATLRTSCPTRWPFGRPVFPSEVYAVLDGVAGVDAVSSLALRATRGTKAIAPDNTGAIPVPRSGLVFAGAHDLTVDTDTRRTG